MDLENAKTTSKSHQHSAAPRFAGPKVSRFAGSLA
jgi:hypothetical protein